MNDGCSKFLKDRIYLAWHKWKHTFFNIQAEQSNYHFECMGIQLELSMTNVTILMSQIQKMVLIIGRCIICVSMSGYQNNYVEIMAKFCINIKLLFYYLLLFDLFLPTQRSCFKTFSFCFFPFLSFFLFIFSMNVY